MVGIGRQEAQDVDHVGYDGGRGGQGAGARAIQQGLADGVAFHQDGVHDPIDAGEQVALRDQGGMHPQFDRVRVPARDILAMEVTAELASKEDLD